MERRSKWLEEGEWTKLIVEAEHIWNSCDAHEWANAIEGRNSFSGVTNQVVGCLGWNVEEAIWLWSNMDFWLPGGVLLPSGVSGSDGGGSHAHPSGAGEGRAGKVPAV